MEFGTSIHCMDGRIQEPLIKYIKDNYNVRYVDTITEPGPGKILSQKKEDRLIESIEQRLAISIENHGSKIIFISSHFDCAGNPSPREIQIKQLRESEAFLRSRYPEVKIVKLRVNEDFEVEEIY